MDNISHSIAGLAVGELAHRSLPTEPHPEDQRQRRRVLLVTAWLASNFPDLDLVLTPLLPAPLGYLLHHRGHTHTLLYAIPQALFIWAGIWLLWPSARRLLKTSASARKGLLLALAGSFIVHLLMDFLNSYGLHPFHPFDSDSMRCATLYEYPKTFISWGILAFIVAHHYISDQRDGVHIVHATRTPEAAHFLAFGFHP